MEHGFGREKARIGTIKGSCKGGEVLVQRLSSGRDRRGLSEAGKWRASNEIVRKVRARVEYGKRKTPARVNRAGATEERILVDIRESGLSIHNVGGGVQLIHPSF